MSWILFKSNYLSLVALGFALDTSKVDFSPQFLKSMEPAVQRALEAMKALEGGAIANPDEKRQVGHYWLRAPELAPTPAIKQDIEDTLSAIKTFAAEVHHGKRHGAKGAFKNLVCIGIGGSALGPQFVSAAIGSPSKLRTEFIDNTDPDGFDAVWEKIGAELGQTLVVIISKSGSTPEPRNAMLEAEALYARAGLKFGDHAVAVTGRNSQLDQYAHKNGWLATFPMWDWVGGRTSELAAVGLLPAALQGINIDELLRGAREMDQATRQATNNPAMQLALSWYALSEGKGSKDMVIIPYKDRLCLFARYLQQLIMESIGKEKDLDGKIVHQGLSVYGNKGSTDQHAYIQQLRDGVPNFFVTFIEVQKDRTGPSVEVEPHTTAGDFLEGFYLGTREALYEKGRHSITLTIRELSPYSVGMLIALYERAVGFYSSFININAYHQPGVEAGKKAASAIIALQHKATEYLRSIAPKAASAEEIATALGCPERTEIIFKLLERLAANPERSVRAQPNPNVTETRYHWSK